MLTFCQQKNKILTKRNFQDLLKMHENQFWEQRNFGTLAKIFLGQNFFCPKMIFTPSPAGFVKFFSFAIFFAVLLAKMQQNFFVTINRR